MVRCDNTLPSNLETEHPCLCIGLWKQFIDSRCCLEELSEEDQQLKSELEMLVERLKV